MPSYDANIATLAERAVDAVIDAIAVDGVKILTSLLESSGFMKNDMVRDYEVLAHVSDDEIWFEIVLDMQSLDEESQEAVRAEPEEAPVPPRNARIFTKNGFGQIGQVVSFRDVRVDARRPAVDARRDARHEPKHLVSARKTAAIRDVLHGFAAHAPRSLRLDSRSSRVSLQMKSKIQRHGEGEQESFVYQHRKFDGIIGDFLDKLNTSIAAKFADELERIIARYTS